jgi:uncharacterized protein YprB with RNaseH-like and TPR domain
VVVYLDIETSGMKADRGMIVAVGLLKGKEPEVRFADTPEGERGVLEWLRDELEDCNKLVTWYGSGFDIPFLLARAALHEVDIRRLIETPMLDICEWSHGHLLLSNHKLESVARFFGIRRALEFHGEDVSALFKLAARGDLEARKLIVDHCKEDLILLKRVHERLKPMVERSRQGLPQVVSKEE